MAVLTNSKFISFIKKKKEWICVVMNAYQTPIPFVYCLTVNVKKTKWLTIT